VRRAGAKSLSLFHRLGITLVILGLMQSFAPTCFRPTRSSLRVMGNLRLALFAPLLDSELATATPMLFSGPSYTTGTGQDQESDQESHDTEDLSETFALPEAVTSPRSWQRHDTSARPGPLPKPGRTSHRTRSALQSTRALPILAALSATATSRLCRFTC